MGQMAGSLYGCMLTCVSILAANVFSYGATQIDLGNGFKILSKEQYSEMINTDDMSHRKDVVQCNFDNGLCGFRNENSGDNFDWTLRSRSTPSLKTGPSSDISGKGSYIYIEASRPQRSGHKARLLTPVLPGMVYCLQFGFHAYGNDIGALVVYKKDSSQTKEFLLKLENNYGNKWLYVVGTVGHHSNYQIEFEGVCGESYRGDIALDNVTITEGMCYRTGKIEECGYGYPGISSAISTFPPVSAWPWLVGLSSSRQAKVLCSGVQVSSNWVLTSRTCAQKFTKLDIATYTGNANVESRKVVKSMEHPLKTPEIALLQLNKSTSRREVGKVCLPPSIDLSTVGRSQEMCYLLAASFASNENIFKDSTVSILSKDECTRHLQSIPWKYHSKRQLFCVQPAPGFKINFNTTAKYDVYVVCKNKILQRWILLALGSFSYHNMTSKPLVFTQVSSLVDWIEKIVNVSILVPKPPRSVAVPKSPEEPLRGFQIFEQTEQKCLALINPTNGRFTYQKCNIYDISQRFEWSSQNQIVILKTNRCLMTDFIPYYYLGSDRCHVTRKSQQWICLGNRIENGFHRKWFIGFSLAKKGWVHLINVHDEQRRGSFVVYGTDDTLCSNRKTVNGDFKCGGVHRGPMCGFENLSYLSQYIWTVWKPKPSELNAFPQLQSSGTIFKTAIRRGYGDKTAVLNTPWFRGQRCVQFYSYLHGSPFNQLTIHKYESGRNEMLLRINANGGNKHQWLFHRVTVSPKQCEAYQVLFKAFLSTGGSTKVGLRDVQVLNGACEPIEISNKTNGKCLKGWTFFNGSCFFPYDVKTSWHQALHVCQITGADLPTDIVASKLVPRGGSAWSGVRSCPNGRWYSTQAVQYYFRSSTMSHATCVQLHFPATRGPVYRSSSCDTKVPFVCQKDPKKTENGCGLMNSSISNEPSNIVGADRQWPWHVVIVVFRKCECGGTLVAPGYIVTSNLCVTRVLLEHIKIFIPSFRFVIRRVKKVIFNPKFGKKSGDNDVAIILFDEHLLSSFSKQFACVNKMTKIWEERKSSKSDLLKDTKCFVVGWGSYRGGFGTCGPNNYRVHEVEILDKTQCDMYYGNGTMTERMLCVRPRNQGMRSCLGDTGGPLVCEIAGAWTLVGVTTWGSGCTTTRKYGIYTDVASVRPWMEEVKTQQSIYNS